MLRRTFPFVLAVAFACGSDPDPHAAPVLATFSSCKPPAQGESVALVPAFGGATFKAPVEMVEGPGRRFYVLEQGGIVKVVPRDGGAVTTALDISSRIVSGGETGLLGIAFDSRFAENGFVYLYFTAKIDDPNATTFQDVLVRMKSADGGATIDAASQKILLKIDDPFANHNGGKIAVGPDGMLYLGLGDGGSGGDPKGNGQNKDALLGKILRIDPNAGDPYGIPADNPFAAGGGRPEIFAYGLRNPWKFSFDRTTGKLWCGDVGQGNYEEVDIIERGGNYGWNVREGKHCYAADTCPSEGFIDPIAEYSHDFGASITGGYVYRGTKLPGLVGRFVYGDFSGGTIWSVGEGDSVGTELLSSGLQIASFGQDSDGEIYVVDYRGSIKQFAPGGASKTATGAKLSETGCLDPANAIRYDVKSPLWSDGADKERWVFLPQGGKIGVAGDGDFELPPASVAVKTFSRGGKKLETRLFVRYPEGGWAGYSYEWNDEQTDALLLDEGKTKDLGGGASWHYPSRSECFSCHTAAAGFTLGLEARQVDLAPFAASLANPVARESFPLLADDGRAYLHSNCSMCHREGAGPTAFDLRIDRTVADMKICNVAPQAGDQGVQDARIVVPGDPAKSLLTVRMHKRGDGQMPPLATQLIDEAGVASVETWIRGLACP